MPVATITLETTSTHDYDDLIVVSAPNDTFLDDDIILDVDPQGMYDTGFTVRTQSGAFETGGRIVGVEVPIREPVLPFWLSQESRVRFQRLWGTPYNFKKVKATWDGPSGPRSLILKLAKEILYTTEDGFDAAVDESGYHAVVSALAVNPMYEGLEDVQEWSVPDDRFTVTVVGANGTFQMAFGGQTTTGIPWNAAPSVFQAAVEALSSVGAGKVTITGTPASSGVAGVYQVVFAVGTNGVLTSASTGGLGGSGKKVDVDRTPSTGWFEVWNPTDQPEWLEWTFDPAKQWQFPDFGFGQERKWGRAVGQDAARMIVTPQLTQLLSVMSDPFMDTYVNADLSNAAGLFNGVEPIYMVPPYTGTSDDPVLMPVIVLGAAGVTATLRQRRFWSAESGLDE